jgi:hypothetical protein
LRREKEGKGAATALGIEIIYWLTALHKQLNNYRNSDLAAPLGNRNGFAE